MEQCSFQAEAFGLALQLQGHVIGARACHFAELFERSGDTGAVAAEPPLADLVEHPGTDRIPRVDVRFNLQAGAQLLGSHVGVTAGLDEARM
ncbi:MAG: hypothetical protein C0423_01855 [Methylibium sp.]|nr:hypothetical protein [Methylibium sp.]